MEVWAQDYVDEVVPGFIEFTYEEDLLMGTFQFGTVSGGLDGRLRDIDGVTFIEWSWQGQSDTDPGSGRGCDLPRRRHPSYAASIFYRLRTFTLRIHGYLQASLNYFCRQI